MMQLSRLIMGGLVVLFTIGILLILSLMPAEESFTGRGGSDLVVGLAPPFRIGLIPEDDVFAERRNHQALAGYVQRRSGRRVELVTERSHRALLERFTRNRIDAALLDPLMAAMATDHCGAVLLASLESTTPTGTHRAVVFARQDAPIRTIDDLAGRSIAMVRSTLTGELYALFELQRSAVLGGDRPPELIHADTHQAVIGHVVEGRADAGVTSLRILEVYAQQHPETPLRRLATSEPLPRKLLVARAGDGAEELRRIVTAMEHDPQGRAALAAFGAARFAECRENTLATVRRMMAAAEGHLAERLIATGMDTGGAENLPEAGRDD